MGDLGEHGSIEDSLVRPGTGPSEYTGETSLREVLI